MKFILSRTRFRVNNKMWQSFEEAWIRIEKLKNKNIYKSMRMPTIYTQKEIKTLKPFLPVWNFFFEIKLFLFRDRKRRLSQETRKFNQNSINDDDDSKKIHKFGCQQDAPQQDAHIDFDHLWLAVTCKRKEIPKNGLRIQIQRTWICLENVQELEKFQIWILRNGDTTIWAFLKGKVKDF